MTTYSIQLNDREIYDLERLMAWGREERCEWLAHKDYDGEDSERAEQERAVGESYDSIFCAISYRNAYWSTGCGSVELWIPVSVIEQIAVGGDNEPAVKEAIAENGYIRRQLMEMDMAKAQAQLEEAGLEDFQEGGESRWDLTRIMRYTLWMACHDINDSNALED